MNPTNRGPIRVTGAAGRLGPVGRTVTGLVLDRRLPVRALVRREDERAAALQAAGAEVVVGDLLDPADVYRVVSGCRRVFFGVSLFAGYMGGFVYRAAVARVTGVYTPVQISQLYTYQSGHHITNLSPTLRHTLNT